MFMRVRWLVAAAFLGTAGFGCWWGEKPTYVPAQPVTPVEVTPSVEGGQASTGGESATITPNTPTAILIDALPSAGNEWTATEPVEKFDPVPLPDGTRTEYVRVERTYERQVNDMVETLELVLTDTRGIPALLAFVDSFAERRDAAGYRSRVTVGDHDVWITYAYGPHGESDGSGSVMFAMRNRFIVQIDGKQGTSVETLRALAERFDSAPLN
jgi:hypothetical protein